MKISVDAETVIYAVQDIFTQGILGYWLVLVQDSAQTRYVMAPPRAL